MLMSAETRQAPILCPEGPFCIWLTMCDTLSARLAFDIRERGYWLMVWDRTRIAPAMHNLKVSGGKEC